MKSCLQFSCKLAGMMQELFSLFNNSHEADCQAVQQACKRMHSLCPVQSKTQHMMHCVLQYEHQNGIVAEQTYLAHHEPESNVCCCCCYYYY